jgi:hypothetical protein
VAALLASGAAQLSDPFFPPDREHEPALSDAADGDGTTALARLARRLVGLLRLGGGGGGGSAPTATATAATGTFAPPWELTRADVAALRAAAAGGRARRHERQLGATVSLPFGGGGGGGALLLGGGAADFGGGGDAAAVPLALPGVPGLTTADGWAWGFGMSADEFDYTTDIRTGDALSGVLAGGGGGALSSLGGGGGSGAASAGAPAADGGGEGGAGGGGGGEVPRVVAGAVAAALGMKPAPARGGDAGADAGGGDSVAAGLHGLLASVGGGGGGSLFTPLDCLSSECGEQAWSTARLCIPCGLRSLAHPHAPYALLSARPPPRPAAATSRPEGRLAFLSAPRPHMTSAGDEVDRREVDAFGRVLWYRPVELLEVAEAEAERRAKARAAAAAAATPPAASDASSATADGAASTGTGGITWGDVLEERRMLRAVRSELHRAGVSCA